MKKYIYCLILSFAILSVYSQEENSVDSKTSKKLTKEQKIEQRKAQEEYTASIVDSLLKAKRFILEANYLSDNRGNRVIVNSSINFIKIDTSQVVIQIASNSEGGGANGLGGITAAGSLREYELKKIGNGKSLRYTVKFTTVTNVGIYDIFLNISPTSNCDASITSTTSGRLNYHGYILPIEKSRVFKGMTT